MMAKQNNKRTFILLGILGVLLLVLVLNRTVFSDKKDKKKMPTKLEKTEMSEGQRLSAQDKLKTWQYDLKKEVKPISYIGSWSQDPFHYLDEDSLRALRGEEGVLSNLKLTGISLHRDSGYSLINSMIISGLDTIVTANFVEEGDRIGDFYIVKIGFDFVILRKGREEIRLELNEY